MIFLLIFIQGLLIGASIAYILNYINNGGY